MAAEAGAAASSARHPVVAFDLDGTLLRGTTVSLLTAEWLGRAGELDELERSYRAGLVSNAAVADASASWFAGHRLADVAEVVAAAPWIAGIAETVARLRERGAHVVLATVTWRFVARLVADRFGFDACCGTELELDGDRLGGRVTRHFDARDKAEFVTRACAERGVAPDRAAAVGDSRSDLALFERVGFSIALNADDEARRAATVALEADDLRDVLPLLE